MQIGQHSWFSFACALAAIGLAQAQTATETPIHSFQNFPQGANPYSPLARDAAGNLYGTTYQGGQAGDGALYKIDTSGNQTVLHSFTRGADGANPYAGVALDSAGNLYGTTYYGGAANTGVVYKVSPSGQETVLYAFTGGTDGGNPHAGVILDSAGNLYGTTYYGGAANAGVVYKVDPTGQETLLHSFTGGADGANPYAGVIADAAGNLYGTTYLGGANGQGVIYKLDTANVETVLHAFGGQVGGFPQSGLVADAAGNFYGTVVDAVYKLDATGHYTVLKGLSVNSPGGEASVGTLAIDAAGNLYGTTRTSQAPDSPSRFGLVYKLGTGNVLTVLYRFPGPPQHGNSVGGGPTAGVLLDPAGNIYGATPYGGVGGMVYVITPSGQEKTIYRFPAATGGTEPVAGLTAGPEGNFYGTTVSGGPANQGVVFKVDPAGNETVLYSFKGGTDGGGPMSAVTFDGAGNLYGTTRGGGAGNPGTIYRLEASGNETVLHVFTGGYDGALPSGVVLDPAGNLYGTTASGGTSNQGVIFKVDPAGQETVLYTFIGGADGGDPNGVIRDPAGNLYGTTHNGGLGTGVIFELDAAGQFSVLHSFTGSRPGGEGGGGSPDAGVIRDEAGNLYGTTAAYGITSTGHQGEGVVYELDAAGHYTVLYTFTGGSDGAYPESSLVRDSAGNLYGTANGGGTVGCNVGCGVVFEVSPSGQETSLYGFTGGAEGANPAAGLLLDPAANLYGTTPFGGNGGTAGIAYSGAGLVYKVTVH